jgi:hypothetical protein
MTRQQIHVRSIAVIALSYIAGALAFPRLPGLFVAEQPSSRWLIAFALPTATLVIYTLFRSLWRHDRIRTGNGAFETTYQAIIFRTVLFVFALHVVVMLLLTDAMDAVGIRSWGGRSVVVMLGLTIMAIGNLLPRTRPNVAFGVRTARTLADVQLWQRVHRVGGYAAVGLGVITVVAGLVGRRTEGFGFGYAFLAAILASTVVFVSYRRYARV